MAKYVYPAIFHPEDEGGFSIFFPDLSGCYTQGEDLSDGMYMANDVLSLTLYSMEDDGEMIPEPTPLQEVATQGDDFVTYITADTFEYRKKFNNRAVKKTLSIPEWLNESAVDAGVNFSQVLQDALKAQLGVA